MTGNSAFTVRPRTWRPADLLKEATARGVRGKPKTSSTPNGPSELKVPVLRCSNKYIHNKSEKRKRNCAEMRVFSRLQGVRAKETAPGCLHPPAWGPLLGHLPASPAPGWPAARVPVGPGTPPSPREAAVRGEGCARQGWAAPRAASALRHQQDGKDVPRSSPGAGHCGAPAHGASRRKSGATILQLAFGRKERKATMRKNALLALPALGSPLPGLGIPVWTVPRYPKRPCSSPCPVGHPLLS